MTTNASDETLDYRDRIKRRVQELLRTKQNISFSDLVGQCQGAFPADVLSALQELGDSELIGTDAVAQIPPHQQTTETKSLELLDKLPEPHPADFDWRFTTQTRKYLADQICTCTTEVSRILLLCAPTLLDELASRRRNALLIDHNEVTIQSLSSRGLIGARAGDIFDPKLPIAPDMFDVCVIDPPWYPEHYRSCLVHAAQALHLYGMVWMSVLPPLTRPAALADRRAIVQQATILGFDIVFWEPARLSYEIPPFERATLQALSLECGPWRKGDLLVLRKVIQVSPEYRSEVPSERWRTFLFGQTQVKLRIREGKLQGFSADLIAGCRTLLSVSRRFPQRDQIDAWNSRNIAYSVSNIEPLRIALTSLQKMNSRQEAVAEAAKSSSLTLSETNQLDRVLTDLVC